MRDALIIPTYGFITHEDTPGSRGTKARVAKAAELIRQGVVARNCIVPYTQMMFPEGRELELLGRISLGKNVAAYTRSLPLFAEAEIVEHIRSKGTFDDTITSLEHTAYTVESSGETEAHVHFVSDWSQLGRLWLIWHLAWKRRIPGRNWKVSFHLVPNFRTVRDVWLHEPPAYLKCLWNCFKAQLNLA